MRLHTRALARVSHLQSSARAPGARCAEGGAPTITAVVVVAVVLETRVEIHQHLLCHKSKVAEGDVELPMVISQQLCVTPAGGRAWPKEAWKCRAAHALPAVVMWCGCLLWLLVTIPTALYSPTKPTACVRLCVALPPFEPVAVFSGQAATRCALRHVTFHVPDPFTGRGTPGSEGLKGWVGGRAVGRPVH